MILPNVPLYPLSHNRGTYPKGGGGHALALSQPNRLLSNSASGNYDSVHMRALLSGKLSFYHISYVYRRSYSGVGKMRFTIIAALIVVLTASSATGQTGCSEITEAALENVIRKNIPTRADPHTPTVVDVLSFHPVCLAYSQERDRYRFVSVVVEYTCTGNANCPSGTAVEQFESQCKSGTWSHSVQGDVDNTRTVNPTANFSTTTREDCAFCFSPALATGLSVTTDPDTQNV